MVVAVLVDAKLGSGLSGLNIVNDSAAYRDRLQ